VARQQPARRAHAGSSQSPLLHRSPIPRTGGIGIHAGVLLALGLVVPNLPYALWPALALLLVVSVLNDVREIAVHWRLAAHFVAGALFAAGVLADHGVAAAALATVGLVWMANLYNFMDGSDGPRRRHGADRLLVLWRGRPRSRAPRPSRS
jgi:UDP-N-acetylmuramyl pentapeptide phosphotransferase/UDP-N-acetylglucosamine-1-phosphate transferase